MFGIDVAFNRPGFLLLLAAVPFLWGYSYRGLAGLGRARRWMALLLRTAVWAALVLALAELQLLRTSEKLTVLYLLDQSASVPAEARDGMLRYVAAEVAQRRDDARRDRAGVIVFGRTATIEVPPLDDELPVVGQLESLLDVRADATHLAAAMKLAQATFPEDAARRIVIISDGNENLGDARAVAELLVKDGVGIDVMPVPLTARAEVAVEKVVLPADIRKGQPFEARVVVQNTAARGSEAGGVRGTLRLARRMGRDVQTLDERPVELPPGKSVYRFQHELDEPDFYEYQATFVADDPADDGLPQNNRATAFTQVLGAGHVLLIQDWEHAGEFDELVSRLRAMNLQVTVQGSDELFSSLAELQRYDCVILANVPRSSGGSADAVTNFSDDQVQMLVRNTQQLGSGLIMIGGPNSFGAGGWSNTELEKAMPVDFQIQDAKVAPVGALVMVMHASEMAEGNHWQKVIAQEALKALGGQDYCGVIHWDGQESWLWGKPSGLARVGANRPQMLARLSRMTPGDMPDFDPSLKLAAAGFATLTDAAIKHMIVISDGDPSPPSRGALQALRSQGARVTTVAVGTHGPPGSTPLQQIATFTGGKYYVVNNPQALPRIYQREARRVARPLVKEELVQPRLKYPHEIVQGIGQPPPIRGFVLTSVKENPLVEVALVSPVPPGEKNATILASWTYGLGRTVVLTTDAGKRWATDWTGWDQYDKLFSQMVRWAMRPTGDQGRFNVVSETRDETIRLTITALDQRDQLLNFLDMSASAVAPDMSSREVPIRQVAPGRYVGEFPADQAGSYLVSVTPGAGRAPLRSGVTVPYSAEYRQRETNRPLLEALASLEPVGGRPGLVLPYFDQGGPARDLPPVNTFRHDLARAVSSSDVWPLLVLAAACLFFGDVLVRRVAINLDVARPLWVRVRNFVLRRQVEPVADERMQRLRSGKAQVGQQIDQRRAAARFEPAADRPAPEELWGAERPAAPPAGTGPPRSAAGLETAEQAETETYTTRLLKAKQRARKDHPPPDVP